MTCRRALATALVPLFFFGFRRSILLAQAGIAGSPVYELFIHGPCHSSLPAREPLLLLSCLWLFFGSWRVYVGHLTSIYAVVLPISCHFFLLHKSPCYCSCAFAILWYIQSHTPTHPWSDLVLSAYEFTTGRIYEPSIRTALGWVGVWVGRFLVSVFGFLYSKVFLNVWAHTSKRLKVF